MVREGEGMALGAGRIAAAPLPSPFVCSLQAAALLRHAATLFSLNR